MGSKKASNNLIHVSFTKTERKSISCALLIPMASPEYLDRSKASIDNAFDAADKLDYDPELYFTRGEARAITASVDIALQILAESPEALVPVEEEFEGAIKDITEARPVLEQLAPRLHAVFSKHPRK